MNCTVAGTNAEKAAMLLLPLLLFSGFRESRMDGRSPRRDEIEKMKREAAREAVLDAIEDGESVARIGSARRLRSSRSFRRCPPAPRNLRPACYATPVPPR